MLKKIDHINIVVRDLEKAKKFFLDLGFILIREKKGEIKGSFIEKATNLKNIKAYYCTVSLSGA